MRCFGGAQLPPSIPVPTAAQTCLFWVAPFDLLEHCRARYGERFTVRLSGFPAQVFLADADEIKAMLLASSDVLHPGEGGRTVMPIVGESSFMLHDEKQHMHGRKTVLPAFHRRAIGEHAEMAARVVREEVASWPLHVPIALHPRLRALTLKVILRVIFGSSQSALDERFDTLCAGLLKMLAVTASPAFPVSLLRHGPGRVTWDRFLRDRADVDQLIHELIDTRRRAVPGLHDLLTRLLAARNSDGSRLSNEQVRDNVMSLILAGHETTASQLGWAFQLLAHNPGVQARLISEIDRGGSEEYLAATVQETLRHRTVFLFTIPRAVVKPIDIGRWRYGPPARLLGCIYLLHHDPRVYPEPHIFSPERFLDRPPQPYLWLPWGGGRRRCPGVHVAMLEMKTVLRTVLERATVHPAARHMEHPRWRSVIVTPHAGARVVLSKRTLQTSY
jgi:cytochrome P450